MRIATMLAAPAALTVVTAMMAGIMASAPTLRAGASASGLEDRVVTVRVHDYAHVPPQSLASAQEIVGATYREIDVRIEWAVTFRTAVDRAESRRRWRRSGPWPRIEPAGPRPASGAGDYGPTEDLTVIVQNPRMAAMMPWPKDALGTAAVGADGGGRIAYVHYTRVAAAAAGARWSVADLLAVVIAHEMGHLLLPCGAHSVDGLMRAQWDITELRRLPRRTPGFTVPQGALIRGRLGMEVAAAQ